MRNSKCGSLRNFVKGKAKREGQEQEKTNKKGVPNLTTCCTESGLPKSRTAGTYFGAILRFLAWITAKTGLIFEQLKALRESVRRGCMTGGQMERGLRPAFLDLDGRRPRATGIAR